MAAKIPLGEMTIREKIAAMEALWEDLARDPGAIESPDWHKRVLGGRRERVASGAGKFEDWESAKRDIRENLR